MDPHENNVFISYIRQDSEKVDLIFDSLRSKGIEVWLDREEITPGSRWKLSIKNAIKKGSYFIACFSSNYFLREKTYMNEELILAIEELRKRPTDRTWFIPIKLDDCIIPDRPIGAGESLRDLQYIDLHKDWQGGIEKIIQVINPLPSHLNELKRALCSEYENIRDGAKYTCINLGKDAVPAVVEALNHKDKDVKDNAQSTLVGIGMEALPKLIELMQKSPDSEISSLIQEAIDMIEFPSTDIFPSSRGNTGNRIRKLLQTFGRGKNVKKRVYKRPRKNAYKRLQFDFSEATVRRLDELVSDTDKANKAEVIRTALILYEYSWEKVKEGYNLEFNKGQERVNITRILS